MWSLKKFTSAHLFQIAREKSCDYLLIIFMKKLRDSFKITLRGSQHALTTCKNKLFKCCKYHYTCSQNNILLDVFKVCKPQKRAEKFMELFNLFELKILGYYLRVFRSSREFFLPSQILAELWLGVYDAQPAKWSCFALSSNTSLDELNSRSRTMDRVQPFFFKCLS